MQNQFVKIYLNLKSFIRRPIGILSVVALIVLLAYAILCTAPKNYPSNDLFVVKEGSTVFDVSNRLYSQNVIKSPKMFSIAIGFYGNKVISGGYALLQKEDVFTVARRIARGDHQLHTVKVTFPEGMTVVEMANICSSKLPMCNRNDFIEIAKDFEGYLFPDTYFFLESATAEEVFKTLNDTFQRKMTELSKELNISEVSPENIIMASILEEEAQNFENMQKVAGVFYRRLKIGMPLQADATLSYATGRNTYNLTRSDLATSSPFNTYKFKGLPPTPIANPGIESIKASLAPIDTGAVYYLTDKSGRFYFADTYSIHLKNKARYLNNI